MGVVELLLILPIFTGILCVIAWVGFFLIQKTKMEKDAWQIQTRKTYDMDNEMKQINPDYKTEFNRSVWDWARLGTQAIPRLPIAFKGFIVSHPQKHEDLILEGNAPKVLQEFYSASFKNNSNEDVRSYRMKAEMISSGDPMYNAGNTKKLMWAEAMREAGFNYYSLTGLGYTELTGIPVGYIKDAFDLIKEYTEEK